ncbi:hypothetical protein DEO72_LG3g2156 [Vigna unguiculata]|uniref:Uncharacterized protein n=1 Tax=Vigna unguiculata TaxID=3917 RepID=A0A4D6LGI3_VIGUN|nr:hypothetical protein DEO72_LG3g2156 [Vigna unguiculata]
MCVEGDGATFVKGVDEIEPTKEEGDEVHRSTGGTVDAPTWFAGPFDLTTMGDIGVNPTTFTIDGVLMGWMQ